MSMTSTNFGKKQMLSLQKRKKRNQTSGGDPSGAAVASLLGV
jgi:hypothetical protein